MPRVCGQPSEREMPYGITTTTLALARAVVQVGDGGGDFPRTDSPSDRDAAGRQRPGRRDRSARNPATTGSVRAPCHVRAITRATAVGNGRRRITRDAILGRAHASCTDSTGHRSDGTRRAGITWRPGPRAGPHPRPLRPAILLLCVTSSTVPSEGKANVLSAEVRLRGGQSP